MTHRPMTPREIIAEAWALTGREKSIKRWGFASSFFATLLNLKLVGYQVYFAHAYLVGHEVGFFDDFIILYRLVPLWAFLTIVILFLILLGVEFIFPNLAQGAIIGLAAKSRLGEKVEGGFVLALYNFFPILAIHEFVFLASWSTCVTIISLTLRYVESDFRYTMIAFTVFFFLLSNLIKFFFAFAEPAVVIRKIGIFEAMGQSFKLMVSYLHRVVFLWLLLLMISIRVLINTVIVLVIPFVVVGMGFVLALFLSAALSYIIAGIVGLILLIAASWLFAYLHVFHEAVWVITYMEFRKNKDLDHIDPA